MVLTRQESFVHVVFVGFFFCSSFTYYWKRAGCTRRDSRDWSDRIAATRAESYSCPPFWKGLEEMLVVASVHVNVLVVLALSFPHELSFILARLFYKTSSFFLILFVSLNSPLYISLVPSAYYHSSTFVPFPLRFHSFSITSRKHVTAFDPFDVHSHTRSSHLV